MICAQVLLAYQLDTRPKVRKRAQAGVQAVLAAVHGTPASAPASDALLKCESSLRLCLQARHLAERCA